MKTLPLVLGALMLGSVAAQEPAAQEPATPPADERMKELDELQQVAIKNWRAAIEKARNAPADGGAVPAMPMRPDYGPVAAKALAYAKDYKGTDDAVPFLLKVVQFDQTRARKAIEVLIADHVNSPELAQMGSMMPFLARITDEQFAEQALAKLIKSESVEVRGWAMFAKHKDAIASSERDSDAYKDARAKLVAVAKEVSDKRLAQEIRGAIDEREKFGIGCTAPDIAGVDLDGVEFKLSDYKGKVIFLDFWGDW